MMRRYYNPGKMAYDLLMNRYFKRSVKPICCPINDIDGTVPIAAGTRN